MKFDNGIFFTVLFSIYSFNLLQNLVGTFSAVESMSMPVLRLFIMVLIGTVFSPTMHIHILALAISWAATRYLCARGDNNN